MHVVEATLYYSAGLVPVLMGGLHPVVALAWIVDCAVGAWLGHDGFQVYYSCKKFRYLKLGLLKNDNIIISNNDNNNDLNSGLAVAIIFITYITNILIATTELPTYLWINSLELSPDVSTQEQSKFYFLCNHFYVESC